MTDTVHPEILSAPAPPAPAAVSATRLSDPVPLTTVTPATAPPAAPVEPAPAALPPTPEFPPHDLTDGVLWVLTGGVRTHLVDQERALALIADAAAHRGARPLGVVSINLDHIHHFGTRSGDVGRQITATDPVEWLNLIDGAPIAHHARRLTGTEFPKLSGSDLIAPVLDMATATGVSVGVLGGMPEVGAALRSRVAADWPSLRLSGHWTPERRVLDSASGSAELAAEIRAAGTDILVVCLGKPRQERWIAEFGAGTGAGALLAFGAVVDFLAGRVSRAPQWISDVGLEWAWRLMLEPRRLARRYLIQGPPAYLALRRPVMARGHG